LKRITIDHPHNEASAILGVQNRGLMELRGWDTAFWAVSDEQAGPEAVAVLGRHTESGRWEVERLRSTSAAGKRTEDCETIARAGSWVYVFGSQYGSKDGPLEPKRHFVMRFNEALVEVRKKSLRAAIEVARAPFVLHRLINDALSEASIEVLPPGDELYAELVRASREEGHKKKKTWRDLLRDGDSPVNVEGATFLPGGHLLLGLRYPVTSKGHPIVVELEGIDRLFEKGAQPPRVVAVRVIRNIGSSSRPAGIRELDYLGGTVHAITGDLDSQPDKSAIVDDHPEGTRAPNEHWTFPLVLGARGATQIKGQLIRRFTADATVEGLALDAGHVWYAHDHERIVLDVARLDTERT
jgi:hypothetical protein